MCAPTAYSLSKMYSQLLGREVGFTLKTPAPDSKAKAIFGVYKTEPVEDTIVVKADLPLLGSLAGVFVGLPAPSIAERLKEPKLDELLGDAIHELFNITSTPLSTEARVVFKTMHLDRVFLPGQAEDVLAKPLQTSSFEVSLSGYPGGVFQVFSNSL